MEAAGRQLAANENMLKKEREREKGAEGAFFGLVFFFQTEREEPFLYHNKKKISQRKNDDDETTNISFRKLIDDDGESPFL